MKLHTYIVSVHQQNEKAKSYLNNSREFDYV